VARLSKALCVQQTSLPQPSVQHGEEQGHLFVVADGMGGHAAGEKASAMTVDAIEYCIVNISKWFIPLGGREQSEVQSELQKALRIAEERLFDEIARHPELTGMGSTLTLAYLLDGRLLLIHVGDSRCYLAHHGSLQCLTRDHTMAQELISAGELTADQAAHSPFRHVITNVIGGHKPGMQVEVHHLNLEVGDRLLLCTDGLTEMVADHDVATVLAGAKDPESACEHLIEMANERGSRDNVTAVAAFFN
jgi:protein phosphatase